MKNIPSGINGRLHKAKEKICELASTAVKSIQNETEKNKPKKERAPVSYKMTPSSLINA